MKFSNTFYFILIVIVLLLAGCTGQQNQLIQAKAADEYAAVKQNLEATIQAQAATFQASEASLKVQLAAALATVTSTPPPEPTTAPTVTPTPAQPTKPEQKSEVKLVLAPGVEVELIRIPAGEFTMGSADDYTFADVDEKPQHTVYLDEYLIGKTEVTIAQYRVFQLATGYEVPRGLDAKPQDIPITNLNLEDVVAFINWLAEWTGRKVTLPTEAQWEKAARGTRTFLFPWGDDQLDCAHANVADCVGALKPVGSYPLGASPYGVLDMTGNAVEVVSDIYEANYYSQSPKDNPTGPQTGLGASVKGGCYFTDWNRAHIADRWAWNTQNWGGFAWCDPGLRVVVQVK